MATSILQGLTITAGSLFAYHYSVHQGFDEAPTRTIVLTVLIAANVFLKLVNRSFYYSTFTTLMYKNNIVLFMIAITITITTLILFIPTLTTFFGFETLGIRQLIKCIGIGFI
ncbi:MAG: cation-translocating P-type ATPase C-terminal domain-containing protein [Ferruginibacter sp.]